MHSNTSEFTKFDGLPAHSDAGVFLPHARRFAAWLLELFERCGWLDLMRLASGKKFKYKFRRDWH